jgi:hypothetical protein
MNGLAAPAPCLLLALLGACASEQDKPVDSDEPEIIDCDPTAAPTLAIGQGQGSEFQPLEDGAPVTLDVAPQGGYGVSVRAKTTGLDTDGTVDVLLETELDGELSATFVNEGTNLYCQDDGMGLLWGVVVGFSSETFPSPDALIDLDGERATLIVGATDVHGATALSEVEVTIEVGG